MIKIHCSQAVHSIITGKGCGRSLTKTLQGPSRTPLLLHEKENKLRITVYFCRLCVICFWFLSSFCKRMEEGKEVVKPQT